MSSTPEDAAPKNQTKPIVERIKTAKNHYEVLGVAPDATLEDIKKAYKEAALATHPDRISRNGLSMDEATELFKRVTEANTTLSDETRRHQYDLSQSDLDKDADEDEEMDVDNDNQDDMDGDDLSEENEATRKRKNKDQPTAVPPQSKTQASPETPPKKAAKDKNRAQEWNDALFDFMTPGEKKSGEKDPNQEWVDQLLRWVLEFQHRMTNALLGLLSKTPTDNPEKTPTEKPEAQPEQQEETAQEEQGLPLLEAMSDTDNVLAITDGSELHLLEDSEPEAPQVENPETAIVPFNPN